MTLIFIYLSFTNLEVTHVILQLLFPELIPKIFQLSFTTLHHFCSYQEKQFTNLFLWKQSYTCFVRSSNAFQISLSELNMKIKIMLFKYNDFSSAYMQTSARCYRRWHHLFSDDLVWVMYYGSWQAVSPVPLVLMDTASIYQTPVTQRVSAFILALLSRTYYIFCTFYLRSIFYSTD